MLTAVELAALRATVQTALPDVCTIVTAAFVSDSAGGHTETTTSTSSTCRVAPDNTVASESTVGERVSAEQGWIVTLPYDVAVTVKDRVVVGDRTFEVVSVDEGRSWDLGLRARCVVVA